jgi:hypothetical protein
MLSLAFSDGFQMSNRFTRVPDRDAPLLPAGMAPVIAIADCFMVAMLSRPSKGSLRRTWVTPATLLLALATTLGLIVGLWLAIGHLDGALRIAAGIGLLCMAVGSAAVTAVGIAQRRA